MSRLSEDVIKQIPILYSETKNKAEVARRLNISVASVNKYLTVISAAPVIEEKIKKPRIKITDEIIQKINIEYTKCKSLKKTGDIIGISATTVKKYLTDENLKLTQQQNDDRDALWYYIYRLFGPESEDKPVSDWNITQMQKFKRQGMPYRGQLLTLKYFYEIKKNSIAKSNRSIGIIPWIWDESKQYYEKQEKRQKEIGEMIQRQLEKDRLEIKYNPNEYIGKKNKHKKQIDLNSL